ncbi:hypothetical protein DWU95_35720, partial [Burkholderia contaminans]
MRSLVPVAVLSCALAALPAVSFAQSAVTDGASNASWSSWSAARAETDAQLTQMTRAGYRATAAGTQHHPPAMQRALERVHHPVPARAGAERAALDARDARALPAGHPPGPLHAQTPLAPQARKPER